MANAKEIFTKQLRYVETYHKQTPWSWVNLRVPGTTVTIALMPGFVEVRDKGLVKKKIKARNRSFGEVLEDLEVFFKFQGKILPPGVLEESLIAVGVPKAKMIISEQTTVEKITRETERVEDIEAKPEPVFSVQSLEENEEQEVPDIKRDEEAPHKRVVPGEVTVIDDTDLPGIEDALSAVESLSDAFMAPSLENKTVEKPTTNMKPQIRIALSGSEEIVAASASSATEPTRPLRETPVIESEDEATPRIEELEKAESIEDLEEAIIQAEDDEQILAMSDQEDRIIETEIQGSVSLEEATASRTKKTPKHAVRPLVGAKVVILGEVGVGKHSIMERAGLKIQEGPEIDGDPKQYIRSAIVQLEDYRVDINVWSFDDAVNARIPRKQFYAEANVIIIVYSVADRWSFESLDFWLKEATVKQIVPPPIILVGNKKDVRDMGEPDPLEPPVTSDEGFKYAESLAKSIGVEGRLHPIAFIETSCLTGEGTEDVFRTASEFYVTSLQEP
ncbi:MAG: Rab family GTPase [Candidatus Thorarchaeota archaeon]